MTKDELQYYSELLMGITAGHLKPLNTETLIKVHNGLTRKLLQYNILEDKVRQLEAEVRGLPRATVATYTPRKIIKKTDIKLDPNELQSALEIILELPVGSLDRLGDGVCMNAYISINNNMLSFLELEDKVAKLENAIATAPRAKKINRRRK